MHHTNQYADAMGRLYGDIPKAVFAAIAFSFAMRIAEDQPDRAIPELLKEWGILHQQGIISQKPIPQQRSTTKRQER